MMSDLLAQKFHHARLLRDELGVIRPDMTWIFARSGLIVYKSDWTDAASVENAIEYFVQIPARRKAGAG